MSNSWALWWEAAGHFRLTAHAVRDRVRQDYLLLLCVGGQGHFKVHGVEYPMSPGDLFLAPPRVPHSYGCDPRTGWDIWYVHFRGVQAANLVAITGLVERGLLVHIHKPGLEQYFASASKPLQEKTLNCGLESSCAVFQLLTELKNVLERQTSHHQQIARAIEASSGGVDQMAAAANMSKYHFIRSFRNATGLTPWRYVINRRMLQARQLLADPDLSIKQIAFRLGFNDPNYFSRLFRKETGVSPKAFRKTQIT